MNTKLTSAVAAALMMGVFSSGAHATIGYCSDGEATGMSVSDVTFDGGNATDCYGIVSGNDGTSTVNLLTDWGTGADPFIDYVRSNDGATGTKTIEIGGVDYIFTLSYDINNGTGTPPVGSIEDVGQIGDWFLSVTPLLAGSTLYFDFVVALKGANSTEGLGYWFFDEASISANPTDGTYIYKLAVNQNDKFQELSHMSVYVRDGSTEDEDPDDPAAVPEPGVLFLMGAGLLGLGMARRRKSA